MCWSRLSENITSYLVRGQLQKSKNVQLYKIMFRVNLIFLELVHILHLEPPESIISGCSWCTVCLSPHLWVYQRNCWSSMHRLKLFLFFFFLYRAEHLQIWRMEDRYSHVSADGTHPDHCGEKQRWPACLWLCCEPFPVLHFWGTLLLMLWFLLSLLDLPCLLSPGLVHLCIPQLLPVLVLFFLSSYADLNIAFATFLFGQISRCFPFELWSKNLCWQHSLDLNCLV